MSTAVAEAYARRAGDYTGAVGSMDDVHPADIHLVGDWAHRIEREILDAAHRSPAKGKNGERARAASGARVASAASKTPVGS